MYTWLSHKIVADLCKRSILSHMAWTQSNASHFQSQRNKNKMNAYGHVHTGSDKARHAAIYLYVLYMTCVRAYKEHISILPHVAPCHFPCEQALLGIVPKPLEAITVIAISRTIRLSLQQQYYLTSTVNTKTHKLRGLVRD